MRGTEIIFKVRQDLEDIINKSYENNGLNIRVSSATLQKLYNEAVAKMILTLQIIITAHRKNISVLKKYRK